MFGQAVSLPVFNQSIIFCHEKFCMVRGDSRVMFKSHNDSYILHKWLKMEDGEGDLYKASEVGVYL